MEHLTRRRAITACLAVLTVGLLAGGCDWAQLGFGANHAGFDVETTITTSNVSTLTERLATNGPSGIVESQPAIVNGVLYALSDDGNLYAYSANGSTGCSGTPLVCNSLWSAQVNAPPGVDTNQTPAVANGTVYVLSFTSNQLEAFDAAGKTNCSGSPTVCTPLWTATVNSAQGVSPTVTNGMVYVTSQGGDGTLEAFDANGVTNCSGTPKVCSPIWTSSPLGPDAFFDSVAAQNGTVYAVDSGGIAAFDASGKTDCSGSPVTCTPMWQYSETLAAISGNPVVSGSTLYVDTYAVQGTARNPTLVGALMAFDANGVTNCSGTPTVCTPLWQSASNTDAAAVAPAVGDGTVFVPTFLGPLAAFDANGVTNCSGTPKVCNPMWTSSVSTDWVSPPAIGSGVVYAASPGGTADGWDAQGITNCANSVCTPLWSSGTHGYAVTIANGLLYVAGLNDSSGSGIVTVYGPS